MYPDLSYLFHDLIGTQLDNWTSAFKTFGVLLALAFLGAGWVLKSELKRREQNGELSPIQKKYTITGKPVWREILINALSAGVLGLKVPFIVQNFEVFQADPGGVIFSALGNWSLGILLFVMTAGYLYYKQSKQDVKPGEYTKTIHPHEKAGDILILAAIFGVIGAKLFSIIENLDAFFRDPIGMFFSGSGLTIYGGLIVAFIAVYFYIKKLNIPVRTMMDIAGMAILVGYGIGRMGCQLSGDGDWGIVAAAMPEWWFLPDWLWSYNYPNNVNNEGVLLANCNAETFNQAFGELSVEQRCKEACGMRYCHELSENVYPTPIYETILSFIFFAILWAWKSRVKVAGTLFFAYMIMNGIERFFIERIRVNPRYDYFGLDWSQAQWISVLFVLIGIAGMLYLHKFEKKKDA